jgi:hypothetical protein
MMYALSTKRSASSKQGEELLKGEQSDGCCVIVESVIL